MQIIKRIMIAIVSIVLLLSIVIFFYVRLPQFGKAPQGKRLEVIRQSPQYRNGQFQNIHPSPSFTGDDSPVKTFYRSFFKKLPRTRPTNELPTVRTNLKRLPLEEDLLIWFGHSSYFIQLNGKRFLVDPVLSGTASPVPHFNSSFKGTEVYSTDDIPNIDYLLITHDHYDHLDYATIKKLRPKIDHIVCGLGVGAHFEHWQFDPKTITELDWHNSISISENFTLYTTPARHFSGRSFKRNNTLWLSFILETATRRLFLGGDGGYDTHFAEIGQKFGGFDLAILENGQYNTAWKHIHLFPEEALQAAEELKAKRLLPVHSSKFKLAQHPWDEPLTNITLLNERNNRIPLVTPMIGEIVLLNDTTQQFSRWWEGVN